MSQTLAGSITALRRSFIEFCTPQLAARGLSQGQLHFILYIGRHPDCSPTELSVALRTDAGHTTRTLAKLAKDQFLTQQKNVHDHRAHTLQLTKKGMEAFHFSHQVLAKWQSAVLKSLTPAEQKTLMTLLDKLIAAQ